MAEIIANVKIDFAVFVVFNEKTGQIFCEEFKDSTGILDQIIAAARGLA